MFILPWVFFNALKKTDYVAPEIYSLICSWITVGSTSPYPIEDKVMQPRTDSMFNIRAYMRRQEMWTLESLCTISVPAPIAHTHKM